MYGVTQLRGGRTDLKRFKKRVQRSYGMQRVTLEQHDELFVKVGELETLLDVITEANNDGTKAKTKDGESQAADN